ncbi:metallophosphoesterase [Clostridium sp. FP2]|uniref:metallophosphoesterase n=1 Tax=Clostridium sp. FP2 TaxID=2724481 RepID=UPI0013E98820|nr:metallophosphoesterase [Clostridium sp. FP2]MBZ9624423.1 metallophosphoesterase [Clostridium sp. FP2]
MKRTFIIGDLHFGHDNVIKYENRPFDDVKQMDSTLINNWNKEVASEDKVIVVGDFGFYNKEKTKELLSRLKGYKVLIMGNHDRRRGNRRWWSDAGFDEVIEYPIILEKCYILSHKPISMSDDMPYFNIHGHVHSNTLESDKYINVSVEVTGYKPVDFECIRILRESSNT